MEDEEVAMVDGVFKGAFGHLEIRLGNLEKEFGNGSSSGCHGGLWWLIMDEEDDEVVTPRNALPNDLKSTSTSSLDFLMFDLEQTKGVKIGGRRWGTSTRRSHHLHRHLRGKWTHDPIDDIVNSIVKMRIMFNDVSKKTSQEHAIRKIGIWRVRVEFWFGGAVSHRQFQLENRAYLSSVDDRYMICPSVFGEYAKRCKIPFIREELDHYMGL
ncbi:hypothetical protein Tco_0547715 [Tanacetum coccineum]